MSFSEYDVVRVKKLLTADRHYDGSESIKRPPGIGDRGTIVHVHTPTAFIVECTRGPDALWIADFRADEIELVSKAVT